MGTGGCCAARARRARHTRCILYRMPWACPVCTFYNESDGGACAMCGAEGPAAAAAEVSLEQQLIAMGLSAHQAYVAALQPGVTTAAAAANWVFDHPDEIAAHPPQSSAAAEPESAEHEGTVYTAIVESNDHECLFHAVARQVYGDESKATEARNEICDFMEAAFTATHNGTAEVFSASDIAEIKQM